MIPVSGGRSESPPPRKILVLGAIDNLITDYDVVVESE
jgi:hypothetical protein